MVKVKIKWGVGYGSHDDEIEVEDDATDEQINEQIWDMLAERLDYGWEREE